MMHAMETSESTEDDSVSDGGPWIGRLSGQERTAFVASLPAGCWTAWKESSLALPALA